MFAATTGEGVGSEVAVGHDARFHQEQAHPLFDLRRNHLCGYRGPDITLLGAQRRSIIPG